MSDESSDEQMLKPIPFILDRVKLKQTIERVVHSQLSGRSTRYSARRPSTSNNADKPKNGKKIKSASTTRNDCNKMLRRAKTAPKTIRTGSGAHDSTSTNGSTSTTSLVRKGTETALERIDPSHRRTSIVPAATRRGAFLNQNSEDTPLERSVGTFGTNTLGSLLTTSRESSIDQLSSSSIALSVNDSEGEITLKNVHAKWRSLAKTLPNLLYLNRITREKRKQSIDVDDLKVDYQYRPRHSNPDIVLFDVDDTSPRNLVRDYRLSLSDSHLEPTSLLVPEKRRVDDDDDDDDSHQPARERPKRRNSRANKTERYIIPGNITLQEYRTAPKGRWKVRGRGRKQASANQPEVKRPAPKNIKRTPSVDSKDSYDTDIEGNEAEDVALAFICSQEQVRTYQKLYRQTCSKLGVVASDSITKNLGQKILQVRHQQLGQREVKAFAIALKENPFVEDLCLTGNNFNTSSARSVAMVIHRNTKITKINLEENNFGSEGFSLIAQALTNNSDIVDINLAGNKIQDSDIPKHGIFIKNCHLTHLTLSRNDLDTETGKLLAEMLEMNTPLQWLDVSWNKIRGIAARLIIEALQVNTHLRHLNVAWNGFGRWCLGEFDAMLRSNSSLNTLDLSGNRIDKEDASDIAEGLTTNNSLIVLKLGSNPLTPEGALDLVSAIEESDSCKIQFLDISRQSINFAFVNRLGAIRERRQFRVIHGPLFKHRGPGWWLTEGAGASTQENGAPTKAQEAAVPKEFEQCDPMIVLMEFMRLRGLRVLDLFHQLDTDASNSLTVHEFMEGLMKVNVPLTTSMLDTLVRQLDADGNGEVDFLELSLGQKEHKRIVFRQLMAAKNSGVAYEDTDIGQITERLKQLIFNIQPETSYGDHIA